MVRTGGFQPLNQSSILCRAKFIIMRNLKDLVDNNKKVKFISYREGEFIYSTECGFEFPVSLSDLGKATLLAEDKAMLFLRYIRKHLETIKSNEKE